MAERITIQLRRSKAELKARAWANDLIDEALDREELDWDGHFERRKKRRPVFYGADEFRRAGR